MNDPVIIPAVLAVTEEEYKNQLDKIEQSGLFDEGWIHVDLTKDTVGVEVINKYPTKIRREIHIMIDDAILSDQLLDVGRVIVHSETKQKSNCLAVNPETSLDQINLDGVELLLIMGGRPGVQGQQLIPDTIQKIKRVVSMRKELGLNFLIGVDGGVSTENLGNIIQAGAEHIVIGSHLMKGDIHENIERLWEATR